MNCCNHNHDKDNKHEHSHRGHMTHMWMMLLCCGAPVLILLFLPAISSFIPGASNVIGKVIPFLCPVMMLMMLPMMLRNSNANKEKDNNNHCETTKNI